jgi:hypothetical protein
MNDTWYDSKTIARSLHAVVLATGAAYRRLPLDELAVRA